VGFVVYKKHPALDLWSTTRSPRGICGLRRAVRVGLQRAQKYTCLKYVEMVLFYHGRSMVRIVAVVRHVSLLRNVQTGCEAH
jgi:hypothetical protein